MSDELTIVLPQMSDDSVSEGLRYITEVLITAGYETSGGLLGGEYGYGAYFENDVFMMHPYCWCEQDDCPWCNLCRCPDDAYEYRVDGVAVDFEEWLNSEHREPIHAIPERQCDRCRDGRDAAPNFLHKPSGSTVRWYKYIGRGMDVQLNDNWLNIMVDCLGSLERKWPPS